MTNLTRSPSARRLAAFLHREECFWMASPSVALLSVLVAGLGRPKRVLVDENAPAFTSSVSRIAGATPMLVAPGEINPTLQRLVGEEGLGAEHVWALATHRAGDLASSSRLSACLPFGVPTIELCLGSMFALARRPAPFPTFTIVSLDAEVALADAGLTAVLTSDASLARRIRRLCLPGPRATDYVIDSKPRGLVHDEADLVTLVESAIAGAEVEETTRSPKASTPGRAGTVFRPSWRRRFQTEEKLLAEKAGLERDLKSVRAESTAQAKKLAGVEKDRDRAAAKAARREETLRSALEEQKRHAAKLERETANLAEREAKLRESWESSQAELMRVAEESRARLESADQARRALETALAARDSEARGHEQLHEMWRAHRLSLDERVAQLEQALAASSSPTEALGSPVEATAVEPVQAKSTPPPSPQREPAPWEAQPPRFATSLNGSEPTLLAEGAMHDLPVADFVDLAEPSESLLPSGEDPSADPTTARPEPAFTPEYEDKATEAEEAAVDSRAWLRSVADRLRRP